MRSKQGIQSDVESVGTGLCIRREQRDVSFWKSLSIEEGVISFSLSCNRNLITGSFVCCYMWWPSQGIWEFASVSLNYTSVVVFDARWLVYCVTSCLYNSRSSLTQIVHGSIHPRSHAGLIGLPLDPARGKSTSNAWTHPDSASVFSLGWSTVNIQMPLNTCAKPHQATDCSA